MTLKKWYLTALSFPILVPLIIYLPFASGFHGIESSNFGVVFIIMGPLYIAGVPYFFFALAIGYWLRNDTAKQLNVMSWFLPLFFIIFFLAYSYSIGMFINPYLSFGAGFFTPYILGYGYFWVLIIHGMTWVLRKYSILKT